MLFVKESQMTRSLNCHLTISFISPPPIFVFRLSYLEVHLDCKALKAVTLDSECRVDGTTPLNHTFKYAHPHPECFLIPSVSGRTLMYNIWKVTNRERTQPTKLSFTSWTYSQTLHLNEINIVCDCYELWFILIPATLRCLSVLGL